MSYRLWADEAIRKNNITRDDKWTERLAFGSQQFIESYLDAVGIKANGRQEIITCNGYVVREKAASYNADF